VAVMALASALLVRLAARLRGGPSARDAFFPLVLMGPGHHMTFLWAFQVQFALSAALFVAAVAIVLWKDGAPSPRALALMGLTLALQVLTGANGLALAVPLLVWLTVAVVRVRDRRSSAWWMAAALGLAAVVAVLLYPVGLRAAASFPPAWLAVQTFLQFASTGLAAGERLWRARALVLVLLTALALPPVVRALRHSPSERWRAAGLLACFAAALLVAASVAVGRAELTPGAGLHVRYTTLAVGLVCLVYLACVTYAGGRAARAVPTALVVLAMSTTLAAALPARGYGEFRRAQLAALESDANRGLPVGVIAARNGPAIFQYSQGTPLYLSRLLAHRAWPFAQYRPDPRVRADVIARQSVPLDAVVLRDLARDDRGFRPTGPQPQIVLRLAEAHPVAGIELRYSLDGVPGKLMRLEVRWDRAAGREPVFPPGQRVGSFPVYATARPQALTTWVYDTLDAIRIDPDRSAARLEAHEVVLLKLAPDWLVDGDVGVPR
jgi:hypothetical protein